jgi:hypothetical protein
MAVFDTLKKDKTELEGTEEYEVFNIHDLDPEDKYTGQPFLTNIREVEFPDDETGEMVKKYSAVLWIHDHANKEKVKCRINLKSMNDNVSFFKKSLGYDIIDSIEELHEPGTAGLNDIYTMSFSELQTYINKLKTITVTIKAHAGEIPYNTFRIIKAEAAAA